MPYLKNIATGAIVGPMADDTAEYRYLQAQRSGNAPAWEETGVEDAEAAGVVIDAAVALTAQVLADAVAAGADASFVVGRAPFKGTISKVEYFPEAAVNGVITNNRTLQVVNLVAGAGNVVAATQNLGAGTNLAAQASNVIPLSVVANATNVNAGDEVEWQSLHVGTGLADPGGLVVVTFTRE